METPLEKRQMKICAGERGLGWRGSVKAGVEG